MDFPEAIRAQLEGRVVRCDVLVRFGFTTGAKRLWNGSGPLPTNDGQTWEGIGGIGSISGLQQAINGASPPLDFTVSGVDSDFAARAKADRASWFNQPVLVYWQFFDENWQCLDMPMPFRFGRMKTLSADRKWDDSGKHHVHTVSIRAEGLFIDQRRPRYGFYTDADQQGRSPGDRFCERVAGIEGKIIDFP